MGTNRWRCRQYRACALQPHCSNHRQCALAAAAPSALDTRSPLTAVLLIGACMCVCVSRVSACALMSLCCPPSTHHQFNCHACVRLCANTPTHQCACTHILYTGIYYTWLPRPARHTRQCVSSARRGRDRPPRVSPAQTARATRASRAPRAGRACWRPTTASESIWSSVLCFYINITEKMLLSRQVPATRGR